MQVENSNVMQQSAAYKRAKRDVLRRIHPDRVESQAHSGSEAYKAQLRQWAHNHTANLFAAEAALRDAETERKFRMRPRPDSQRPPTPNLNPGLENQSRENAFLQRLRRTNAYHGAPSQNANPYTDKSQSNPMPRHHSSSNSNSNLREAIRQSLLYPNVAVPSTEMQPNVSTTRRSRPKRRMTESNISAFTMPVSDADLVFGHAPRQRSRLRLRLGSHLSTGLPWSAR